MKQQRNERTRWNGTRMVLGALAAALVLGGAAMHLSAEPSRADCLSINGGTVVMNNGSDTCTTSVVAGSAVAQSSSVSSNGNSTASSTVIASSDGSATAVAQSSDGNTDGPLVIQSSDVPSSATAACPQAGVAAGPTLVLGPSFVFSAGVGCPLPAPVVSPPASGSLALIGSGRCGSPSMVLGPGGIAMSSGGC